MDILKTSTDNAYKHACEESSQNVPKNKLGPTIASLLV